MADLTTAQIDEINSDGVWIVRMIRITNGSTIFAYTNHYQDITYDGNTFIANNELLDIQPSTTNTVTNQSTTSMRFGIVDTAWRTTVLSGNLIGADCEVFRAFLNKETGVMIGDPLIRLNGVVWDFDAEDDASLNGYGEFYVTFDVRPFTNDLVTSPALLTNSQSQHRFSTTDDIFSLVEASANKNITLI